jgi:hypothetical protein
MEQQSNKLAFTICSTNYLAQAIALGDSLLEHNPTYTFVIGLVDEISDDQGLPIQITYPIIPIKDIEIHDFNRFCAQYNITELNTAVKPFYFSYLFEKNEAVQSIVYLDPDIFVYHSFELLETHLASNQIVLTPHITAPINDDKYPTETDFLNAGIYNLGFIVLKRGAESSKLIHWWKNRLYSLCKIDFENGLFVDQLWLNFATLFYKEVFVLANPGYNMAYWNLQERSLSKNEAGDYIVNSEYPLVFYHFSGYDLHKQYAISKYQNRFSFSDRKDITPIFDRYHEDVIGRGFDTFAAIPCKYVTNSTIKKTSAIKQLVHQLKNWKHSLLQSNK